MSKLASFHRANPNSNLHNRDFHLAFQARFKSFPGTNLKHGLAESKMKCKFGLALHGMVSRLVGTPLGRLLAFMRNPQNISSTILKESFSPSRPHGARLLPMHLPPRPLWFGSSGVAPTSRRVSQRLHARRCAWLPAECQVAIVNYPSTLRT